MLRRAVFGFIKLAANVSLASGQVKSLTGAGMGGVGSITIALHDAVEAFRDDVVAHGIFSADQEAYQKAGGFVVQRLGDFPAHTAPRGGFGRDL